MDKATDNNNGTIKYRNMNKSTKASYKSAAGNSDQSYVVGEAQ